MQVAWRTYVFLSVLQVLSPGLCQERTLRLIAQVTCSRGMIYLVYRGFNKQICKIKTHQPTCMHLLVSLQFPQSGEGSLTVGESTALLKDEEQILEHKHLFYIFKHMCGHSPVWQRLLVLAHVGLQLVSLGETLPTAWTITLKSLKRGTCKLVFSQADERDKKIKTQTMVPCRSCQRAGELEPHGSSCRLWC